MKKANSPEKTRAELLKIARRLGLRGVSTLRKEVLAKRVRQAQQKRKQKAGKRLMDASATIRKIAAPTKHHTIRKPALVDASRRAKAAAPKPAVAAITAPSEELSAHKFEVAPVPSPQKQTHYGEQVFAEEHLGELPEAYGTERLFLTARDPHWLYAYWDLSWQQMADYRGQAADGRLLLRLLEKHHAQPVQTLTLGQDSRNWYIPVNKAATTYSAELGFHRHDGHFHVISRSHEAATPPDALSPDTMARFVTIPIDITFHELFDIIRGHMRDGEMFAEALRRLQLAGFRFPFKLGLELGPWTEEQAAELARILGGDLFRRIQMGSFEITEWLRRRLQEGLSSNISSTFSPAVASWSGAPQKGFWVAVNAELVIYGATEPTAKVTIDGKPVQLRSDGTFSFQYSFPDGQYRLPVVAISEAGGEKREVQLTFERQSRTKGKGSKAKQSASPKASSTRDARQDASS